ncbi:DUF892 family protein [Leucobacter sp. gxy201]|uniref:YciE/YciF ferroxidase family protein n=1 Tax=Leucobacter sp. gxy201 TaxID=2957200 RepID=UPI003DA00BA2
MAQQKLTTPEELFHYQVRSALKMEDGSLEALGQLHDAARDSKIKKLFSHHADETREQISKLEQVFALLGTDATRAPSPASTGIKNQAEALLDKSDATLHNQVALMSALGNEHFEIATYSGLILHAEKLDLADAATLLQENLDQETHTSEELKAALQELLA